MSCSPCAANTRKLYSNANNAGIQAEVLIVGRMANRTEYPAHLTHDGIVQPWQNAPLGAVCIECGAILKGWRSGFPGRALAFGRADTVQGGPRLRFRDGFSWAKVLQLTRDARARIACLALMSAVMAGLGDYVKRWRTALHVTVSALMIAIVGLAITPVAHAAAATATLSVEHTWQTGFIARFAITNASMVPLNDWRLEFDMPAGQSVSHAWNSTVTQSGTHYVVAPANWNRVIAPGGSATGGFRGVLIGAYSPPSNCVLNRQYPCT